MESDAEFVERMRKSGPYSWTVADRARLIDLARRGAAVQWRPIEEAPKDKDIALAGQWLSGRWEVVVGQYLATRWPFVGEGQPTHWMPLPARQQESRNE